MPQLWAISVASQGEEVSQDWSSVRSKCCVSRLAFIFFLQESDESDAEPDEEPAADPPPPPPVPPQAPPPPQESKAQVASNKRQHISEEASSRPFISKWEGTEVSLPLSENGEYNFDVQWGDGMTENIKSHECSHTYAKPGEHTITITGLMDGFAFKDGGDKNKILDILQWGSLKIQRQMFHGCSRLSASAIDVPDLTEVFLSLFAFSQASPFPQVTNMTRMFCDAAAFNGDLSKWDVSKVFLSLFCYVFHKPPPSYR